MNQDYKADNSQPLGVLLVCLGNICRSPLAEAVMQSRIDALGYSSILAVDSAGTGDWHLGHPPDERAQSVGQMKGYALQHLRARQLKPVDFKKFDYILTMDQANLVDAQRLLPDDSEVVLDLLLKDVPDVDTIEVPDPYTGTLEDFERTLSLIELGIDYWLPVILARHH